MFIPAVPKSTGTAQELWDSPVKQGIRWNRGKNQPSEKTHKIGLILDRTQQKSGNFKRCPRRNE
jgi:hypothetical protein